VFLITRADNETGSTMFPDFAGSFKYVSLESAERGAATISKKKAGEFAGLIVFQD
jgi:hypothetical protein